MYITKEEALKNYKAAKQQYCNDMNQENWIKFCDAKSICMRLGVRI